MAEDIGNQLARCQSEVDGTRKAALLESVITSLINDSDVVLDNYQDELCQFGADPHPAVRCTTVRFLLHAIESDPDCLPGLGSVFIEK